MTDTNGTVDFTHELGSFTLEGITFRRKKVPAKLWAETLRDVGVQERIESEKTEGSLLFGVSGDGLAQLIRLALRDEDLPEFDKLIEDGKVEFGELVAIRDWIWEQMTDRPPTSARSSSDGPGSNTEASSRVGSRSPVAAETT